MAVLFALLAVAYTWPLARELKIAVADDGDPLLNAWIINWAQHAFLHQPSDIFSAPIFYPSKYSLAYSENLIGIAIVTMPLHLAGAGPLTVYNAAMLLGFAFAGYAAFVLSRLLTGSVPAGITSGILYAFVPYRFDHLSHLQIVWSGWLPLVLAAVVYHRRKQSWTTAAALCGALVMNGLTNIHWLLFGTIAAATTMAFLMAADRQPLRFWARSTMAFAAAVVLLLPVLLPYRAVSELYGMRRDKPEVEAGSATWSDWLVASPNSANYGELPPPEASHHERHLFPGLMSILLSVIALIAYRRSVVPLPTSTGPPGIVIRALDVIAGLLVILSYFALTAPNVRWEPFGIRLLSLSGADIPLVLLLVVVFVRLSLRFPRAWLHHQPSLPAYVSGARLPLEFWLAATWVFIGIAGSFGLHAFVHEFLFRRVEGFQSIRTPARWAMIGYVGLAGVASFGVAAILQRTRRQMIAAAAVIALALFDLRPRIAWEVIDPRVPPVYTWLAIQDLKGPFLELPFGIENRYLLYATAHHKPIMNGTSGFEPPVHRRLRKLGTEPSIKPDFMQMIEDAGCQLIIAHETFLGSQREAILSWLQEQLAAGKLAFVRRFDHGTGGDWVFAVTSQLPRWRQFRQSTVDPIGHSPESNLSRLMSGQPTYSAETFGGVDSPSYDVAVAGPLVVSGWAVSPRGIRRVEICFANRSRCYSAILTPRPDVTARFPWYPVSLPGFQRVFTERPPRVPKRTTVDVTVVDGSGERTRLPSTRIHW